MRPPAFILFLLVLFAALPAAAQPAVDDGVEIRGFALAGVMRFTASESFDAVLGSASGPLVGGGAQVALPAGFFIEVAAWRYSADGERVFVGPGDEVFPLDQAVTVRVTPIEVTGGWRFNHVSPRVVPYVGGGWSSFGYRETSELAEAAEEVDERHSGFHLMAGAEFRARSWLGIGGEVVWSRIAGALGESGASAAFDEDDLGGTSVRLRVSIGR